MDAATQLIQDEKKHLPRFLVEAKPNSDLIDRNAHLSACSSIVPVCFRSPVSLFYCVFTFLNSCLGAFRLLFERPQATIHSFASTSCRELRSSNTAVASHEKRVLLQLPAMSIPPQLIRVKRKRDDESPVTFLRMVFPSSVPSLSRYLTLSRV